jgi:hypothetical protein
MAYTQNKFEVNLTIVRVKIRHDFHKKLSQPHTNINEVVITAYVVITTSFIVFYHRFSFKITS